MSHLDALLDVLKRLRLPVHVASDQQRHGNPELADFPYGWEPQCPDL